MDLLRLAWRNLWRNRRRTLLTVGAIGFSLLLIQTFHNLAIGSYRQMVNSGVRSGSGHIGIYAGDYALSREETLSYLPGELPRTITGLADVQQVVPRLYLPGLAQSSRESRGILLTGINPELERQINPFLKRIPDDRMIRGLDSRDALIGDRLMDELKLKPGQKLVITVQHRDGELAAELFRIRGVVRTGVKEVDHSLVMVGLNRAGRLAGIPGQVHELAVILHDSAVDRPPLKEVQALLPTRNDVRALSWEEAMPNLADAIKLDYASQKFIFAVILLIVSIGLINTLLMSVMERIREFGILIALGTRPARLRALIAVEALLLGAVGMTVGCALGSGATWLLIEYGLDLRWFITQELEFGGVVFDPILRARWDWPWMAGMGLLLMGICLLASLYPARKAARIEPARAMRHH